MRTEKIFPLPANRHHATIAYYAFIALHARIDGAVSFRHEDCINKRRGCQLELAMLGSKMAEFLRFTMIKIFVIGKEALQTLVCKYGKSTDVRCTSFLRPSPQSQG